MKAERLESKPGPVCLRCGSATTVIFGKPVCNRCAWGR